MLFYHFAIFFAFYFFKSEKFYKLGGYNTIEFLKILKMKSISLTDNEINHIKEVYAQELEKLQKRSAEITAFLKKIDTQEIPTPDSADKKGRKKTNTTEKLITEPAAATAPKRPGRKPKATAKEATAPIEKPKATRGRPAKQKVDVKKEAVKEAEVVLAEPKAKRGRKPKVKEAQAKQPKPKKVKAEKPLKAKKVAKVKAEKPAKVAKAKKTATKSAPAKRGRKISANSKKSRWTDTILQILEKEGKVQTSRQIIDQVMVLQNIPESDRSKTRSTITGSLSDLKLETKRIKSTPVPGQKGELYGLSQWYDEGGNLIEQYKN